jgi:integrase
MSTRLTQALVNRAAEDNPAGTQLYDEEVSGLRIVVGKASASYKLVGRINDGTDRYVTVTIGRTDEVSLRTARERSAALRLALRRGEDPRVPKRSVPTVAEAMERYLSARADELRPQTQKWYRAKVDGPLSTLKKLPVDRIDRDRVRALHESITKKHGKYCANGAMRVLKLLINDVARTHDLPPNPVSRGVRMNKERSRDWAVGPVEMPLLWKQLDGMEDRVRRACWLTMLLTGLRSNDARSMRWEHIDGDGVLFVPSPKGGEERAFRVPLPKLLIQALEEVRSLTRPLESRFIFASSASRSGYIEEIRRTTGFPYAPHQMRHTYRTHALEAGVDFQTVTLLMNHATTHVSFNYVTKAHLVGHMREAQEAVCRRLASFRTA